MSTITIPIEIPSEILVALNESEEEIKSQFQIAIATMLFQQGKLTLGKAIQLSGLSRYEFERTLAKNKISISQIDVDQVFSDADKLNEL